MPLWIAARVAQPNFFLFPVHKSLSPFHSSAT
uniref:Uncharacterized protein n=1 Tax=Anguilla anguilla TaxID=7936 RepID=A0A0E9QCE5_ANGAN